MTKTYAQIAREIAALQATASKLYAIEVKSAVEKVNELIAKYGLSADGLKFDSVPQAGQPTALAAKRATAAPAAAVAGVKYSDGQGRSWGGRGPRPAWLRSAIAAGRSLESFLAAGAADVVAALTKSVNGAAGKSAARKPVATGVAKYVNPKTGAGWSGRGPRPQWLKDALKKRGSKIEDFLGTQPVTAAAAPVPAPAKKVAAKKAAAPARKAATGKAVVKKTVAKKAGTAAAPAPARKAPVKLASKKAVKAPAKTAVVAPARKSAVRKVASKKAPAKKIAVSATPSAAAPAVDAAAPLASA